jgi:hypothetical protein
VGLFAALIVSTLSEEGWKAQTEVVEFDGPNYVSWEADGVPVEEWVSKGERSIHFRRAGKIRSETTYIQVTSRLPRKKTRFVFETSYYGVRRGVYHLLLPRLMVPLSGTIDPPPEWIEKVGDRVAITWTFEERIKPSLAFAKSSESDFESFRPIGEPVKMIFDPAFKTEVSRYAEKAKREGEAVAGEALARFMEHTTPS